MNADVHCAHMQFETELLVDESLFQIMPGTMENADGEQVFSRKILSFKAILESVSCFVVAIFCISQTPGKFENDKDPLVEDEEVELVSISLFHNNHVYLNLNSGGKSCGCKSQPGHRA